MNHFGRLFCVSIFGESHGEVVGVTLDGVPAGIELSEESFEKDLARRKSGKRGTTPRKESDQPHLLTGVFNGHTTGAPLTIVFHNENTLSGDYSNLVTQPRPSHADWVARQKFGGFADYRGGGHFSGRLTLGLVAAGVVAKAILGKRLKIASRIVEIDDCNNPDQFPKIVEEAMRSHDSVGGIIECTATGVPVGLGEPFFGSVEIVMSALFYSIPAVKGVEFGSGFAAARMRGSEHNDPIVAPDGTTATNNAGGIVGGITNGNPIVARLAIKPTASIASPQITLNTEKGVPEELIIKGRHDACIALRVPVVAESAMAIALCDLLLVAQSLKR